MVKFSRLIALALLLSLMVSLWGCQTPNVPDITEPATLPSASPNDGIIDVGQENIERHIKMLNKRLIAGLAELGINMCSATDEDHMSSIASFNFGFPEGNIDREKKLVAYLQERGIKVSLRSSTGTGGIRISMHWYNTPEEIDALVSGIGDYMREFNVSQDK